MSVKHQHTNFLWIYKQFFGIIDSMNLYGVLNLNKIAKSEQMDMSQHELEKNHNQTSTIKLGIDLFVMQ
jgi:hypothetical protein